MILARHDVIMAGVGGRGVQLVGRVLAEAGLARYRNVVWFPSYSIAMRGGASECTVVLSPERIASPLVTQTEAVIVFDSSILAEYVERCQPGGVAIVETSGLRRGKGRKDVRTVPVPALETAISLGEAQASNLVLLGFYVGLVKPLPPGLVETQLRKRFGSREKVLATNREAFRRGLQLARMSRVSRRN